jgi:hypothetical protein
MESAGNAGPKNLNQSTLIGRKRKMIDKLKTWLIGSVIMKKVIQKVAKHAATALIGIMSGVWFSKNIAPVLNQLGISVDFNSFEAGLIIILTGLMGGLWNYLEHRFFKKA